MRKRVITFVLLIAILLSAVPTDVAEAAERKELNIYAMYLNTADKGDATLLESKGRYLLVDIGAASHAPEIVRQLNKLGATHIDVLFSHLHSDHIGSASDYNVVEGLRQILSSGITIDTLYLPAASLTPLSRRYPGRYQQIQNFMTEQGSGQIVYLNSGDQIQFGDVSGQVIGPWNNWNFTPGQFTQYSQEEDRYIAYENNSSLAMIFTCGNTRYFTAGDCYGAEAAALVEKYGSSLRCDIMKLCHHGVGTGNSADLIGAIQPTYSFVPNTGVPEKSSTTGRWRTYSAIKQASKYGMCYLIGNEKKTLIYHIVNDKITLFQGDSIEVETKMTGWQYLYGADGKNRDHDMYYLNSDCQPVTGVKKIGSHYYRFRAGGQMDYGSYSSEGEYLGWKSYTKGMRYYSLSKNKKYAYMERGFDTVEGKYLYFDNNGYKIVNGTEDSVTIEKIGSSYYAMDYEGEITVKDWEEIDDTLYYFDASGKMIRNQKYKLDGEYYLFEKDGTLIQGDSGIEFVKWGSDTYAVREDGTLVAGKRITIDGHKYCFDSKGIMQKSKMVKIGKHKYYFGKSGRLVCNKKFKFKGKTYQSNSKGIVTVVKGKSNEK